MNEQQASGLEHKGRNRLLNLAMPGAAIIKSSIAEITDCFMGMEAQTREQQHLIPINSKPTRHPYRLGPHAEFSREAMIAVQIGDSHKFVKILAKYGAERSKSIFNRTIVMKNSQRNSKVSCRSKIGGKRGCGCVLKTNGDRGSDL